MKMGLVDGLLVQLQRNGRDRQEENLFGTIKYAILVFWLGSNTNNKNYNPPGLICLVCAVLTFHDNE